jgi:transcriptional regulator with XRE-family HTH domain
MSEMLNTERLREKKRLNGQLRVWREKERLSQTDVAEMLGVARSTYVRYENGATMPTAFALLQISRILGIPATELYESFIHSDGYIPLRELPDYVREREAVY